MKLWGGRFTKETNELVNNFNASISFDQKFYKQDIEGSIAHATMLAAQGIISEDEGKQITDGLKGILSDIESGKLEITDEYEDIHTFMEATLIERIGDAGKKLHTGRSRNDQVALDMRLYTRDEVKNVDEEVRELMEVILRIIKENVETYMPGFTHLQKAQPVTVAHHFSAYFEMFKRDRSRLHDIYKRMNYCPLGAGALAGTTYPLNREMTASLLGFDGPTLNSMDSVSDRDYVIEFLRYYDFNKHNLNRALYKDRALYSPDILFERNNTSVYCDVITCAAPNKTVAQKYQNVSDEENTKVLRSRIDFILKIAADNKTDILILGAFGSGVFGQSAKEVASIFKDLLENKFSNVFDKIVFAVPSGNGNLEAFQEIFG